MQKTDVDDWDFLQQGVRVFAKRLMGLEVPHQISAERYERSAEPSTYRNDYREHRWHTRVGSITLQIPNSYISSLLEPRQRSEKALMAVVQEAYVQGVSIDR